MAHEGPNALLCAFFPLSGEQDERALALRASGKSKALRRHNEQQQESVWSSSRSRATVARPGSAPVQQHHVTAHSAGQGMELVRATTCCSLLE